MWSSLTTAPEASWCADGLDNDLDGLIDCADRDCAGNAACPEGSHCADGVDNDVLGGLSCTDGKIAKFQSGA